MNSKILILHGAFKKRYTFYKNTSNGWSIATTYSVWRSYLLEDFIKLLKV